MIETVIVSFDNENAAKIVQIRTLVFVKEQNIDSKIDFDGRDKSAIHVLAYLQKKPVGTARMLKDGHIGRVAVLPEYRHKGIGYALMQALLTEAKISGLSRLYLGSQVHALGFYKRMGFQSCGEIFMEAGIEHIEMEFSF